MLAWYTFDDVQGTFVPDDSGNGRHGTRVDALAQNKCMWFDGVDDRVVVPNFDRDTFTYAAWILREDPATNTPVLFVSTNDYGWGVGKLKHDGVYPDNLNPTGPGRVSFGKEGGSQENPKEFRVSNASLSVDVFHHIAVVFDGDHVRFYLDGALDSDQSLPMDFDSGGGTYQMGWRRTSNGKYEAAFKGWMDDVRIYGRILSDDEIADLARAAPDCSSESSASSVSSAASSASTLISSPSSVTSSVSSPSSLTYSSTPSAPPATSASAASTFAQASQGLVVLASPTCGNATLDLGEDCDDGNDNNADACTNACRRPSCGDAVISPPESCDDGPYNALLPDACRPTCTLPFCGDGIVDSTEACDDGNRNSKDSCTSSCKRTLNEPCTASSDCASVLCVNGLCVEAHVCGNGVRESGEWCDPADPLTPTCTDTCRWQIGQACETDEACASALCRSGFCMKQSLCGDGILDFDEECDDGRSNSNIRPSACRLTCKKAHVGDGVVDPGESCDDGNTVAGDGCSPQGQSERVAAVPAVFELPQSTLPATILSTPAPFMGGILDQQIHAGAPLNQTGPAALAVMAAGAAAGFSWIRRRRR
jgi:cysteine-rich repeat protein